VRHWTTQDLAGRLASGDPTRGKAVWREAQCAACHRLGGEGAAVGPDLTGAGSRYARIDLLKSLTEPSAVISEQFQATLFTLRDGSTVAGRVTGESGGAVQVLVDPVAGTTRSLPLSKVKSREASPVSMMPEGLMDTFTAEEVADLVAFLVRPQ
jgi:putative heme-binding domain-containing protein